MKTKIRRLVTIFIIVQLFGCGGHPMSMSGFMRGDESVAFTSSYISGDVKDSTIELDETFEYIRYFEMPLSIDGFAYYNYKETNLRMGFGLGSQGLTYEVGYLKEKIGLMTWINAGYGVPCYGTQLGYSVIYESDIKFGPVAFYSRNEVIKQEGEKHSFEMSEESHGYKYNEFGGGLFLALDISEKWGILSDFKLGYDPEYRRYRKYISISIANVNL